MGDRTLGYLSQPVVKMSTKSRPRKILDHEAIDSYWYGRQVQKRKEHTSMPRTASEGPANYARVLELAAQGSKLSEAFMQVAREALPSGTEDEVTKKSKSVAANYYRLKNKEEGHTPTPRAPRRASTPATVAASNGNVIDALNQAQTALAQAVTQAQADAAELAELRKFKAGVTAAVS